METYSEAETKSSSATRCVTAFVLRLDDYAKWPEINAFARRLGANIIYERVGPSNTRLKIVDWPYDDQVDGGRE